MVNKLKIIAGLAVLCLSLAACNQSGRMESSSQPPPSESVETSQSSNTDEPSQEVSEPDQEESASEEAPAPQSDPAPPASSPSSRMVEPEPSSTAEPEPSAVREEISLPAVEAQTREAPISVEDKPAAQNVDRIEQELLRLINEERTQHGLEALGIEETMQFAARTRAQEALTSLSHTRPVGTPYYTAFEEWGFNYAGKWHGENLAVVNVDYLVLSDAAVAAALFNEWLASPGHHQNILSENFFQTGIGVYVQHQETQAIIGSAQLFASL